MLPPPFGFSGRIARWPYFKGCVALVVACIIPAVLAFGAVPSIRAGNSTALVALLALLAVFALVTFWISLALQVRRCRDIGWNPWIVIPAWFTLGLADPFLAHLFPALAVGRDHGGTLLGALVNLILVGALIFWPSGGDEEAPGVPRRGIPQHPSPPEPSRATMPASATRPIRPAFGRR